MENRGTVNTDSPTARLGDVEDTPQGWRLRFVRRLPHPPGRVWRALTDPAELESWFPTTIDGDRSAGSPLTFRFRGDQAPPFEGMMIACEEPRLLEFMWGPDRIRIELEPADEPGSATQLTLYDTLEERGKAARDGAGWHVCLDDLEIALGKRPGQAEQSGQPQEASLDWKSVHPEYVARFGAEGASIGPPEGF